jgi:hypothetical protein
MTVLSLSSLSHTWIIDIDGTILKHNGYKNEGDQLLACVKEFWKRIPEDDYIILLSAREGGIADLTLDFLRNNGLRHDQVIFGVPKGERVLINDIKPSGLNTAFAVNLTRDEGLCELFLVCNDQSDIAAT